MSRPAPEIRCIDCAAINVDERDNDGVHELYCPDCGAIFGWKNLPNECRKCRRKIWSKQERGAGVCSSCVVASWSPEKEAAFGMVLGMAFGESKPDEAGIDSAIDEAFKHWGGKADG